MIQPLKVMSHQSLLWEQKTTELNKERKPACKGSPNREE